MPTNPKRLFDFKKLCFDVVPDTVDFRDKMYIPTLVEVPTRIDLEDYKAWQVPILNQHQEGACTGFGLATVANYLLRRRKVQPENRCVSPRMLYEMAKRYDEWPGEGYQGSSARGAMKGWHKHGVCLEDTWPYVWGKVDRTLSNGRAREARQRPLGAYFRVNHKDLVSMHSAISEVGILYTTAKVHEGWGKTARNGLISYQRGFKVVGSHAFVIVAYDERGFWIQNSWGDGWAMEGFARVSYDDWLANGLDVWVARLGVPVAFQTAEATAANQSPGTRQSQSLSYADLRPHIISIGNDGQLRPEGTYGTSEEDLAQIFKQDIPRVTQGWKKKRLFLYAHGGLVGESAFIQRVAEYRSALLNAQIYPLAFVWKTDLWSTVTNILQDAFNLRRPEGFLDDALDFMLDRLDDTLEPLVRGLLAHLTWAEMKENARLATTSRLGGARLAMKHIAELAASEPDMEVHLAGHSAGSIFHAPLIQLLTTRGKINSGSMKGTNGLGIKAASCTLWAPGVSIAEFKQTYLPAIRDGGIGRFALYTLTDEAEIDDHCAKLYNKSLLYLVSNALEERRGMPLLGLEKHVNSDPEVVDIFNPPKAFWIKAPNDAPEGSSWSSKARHHGEFDDDRATLQSTLGRILESQEEIPDFQFKRTSSSVRARRMQML